MSIYKIAKASPNLLFLIMLTLVSAVLAIFPTFTTWINDEPKIFQIALENNLAGTFPVHGLYGSKNIPHGSIAIIFYQVLLLLLKKIELVLFFKTFILNFVFFYALRSIKKEVSCSGLIYLIPLISPFYLFYARMPWDNIFLIPLAAAFLALALISYREPNRFSSFLLGLITFLLFGTHLSSVLIILPVLLILVFKNRLYYLTHIKYLTVLALVFLVLSLPYLLVLLNSFSNRSSSFEFAGLTNFVAASRYLSFYSFYDYFAPSASSPLISAFAIISFLLITLLLVIGLYCFKNKANLKVVSITLLISPFLAAMLGLSVHPHYLHVVFVFYLIPVVLGLDFLAKYMRGVVLIALVSIHLYLAINLILVIQSNCGLRNFQIGTLFNNQLNLTREWLRFQPGFITVNQNKFYQIFPQEFHTLKNLLEYSEKAEKNMTAKQLVISFDDLQPNSSSACLKLTVTN